MRFTFLTIGLATIALLYAASADSLWKNGKSLVRDHKAAGVGDVVTIVVDEVTLATSKADTSAEKKSEAEVKKSTGLIKFLPFLNFGASRSTKGSGSTTRAATFTTVITAKVVKVLPNGNLEIEAAREVVVNKEHQKVTLRGVIRPADVDGNNEVRSSQVADAQVFFDGKGPVGNQQHEGIISRILGFLF